MIVIGFILGTVLGSFVLVLADRSLTKQSFWGRSYCAYCKKKIRWYDLFPIFSYILLKGRCRYCRKKIRIEYVLVEVVMGILVGFLFWQSGLNLRTICHPELVSGSHGILKQVQNDIFCISSVNKFQLVLWILEVLFKTFFIVILAVLFLTDLKKMLIPDRIILPSIIIGFVSTLLLTLGKIGYLYYYLSQSTIGKYLLPPHSGYFQRHAILTGQTFLISMLCALGIGGFFMLLIIITRGKGMGGGDVKLGAFIGLMLGFPQSLLTIILSFILGAVFSIFLLLTGKKHFGQLIPFGPFLVLGSLICLFWGDQILNWYLHIGIS